jgi:hypothetical protein
MADVEELVRSGRSPGPGWLTVTRGAHVSDDVADPWLGALAAWQLALPETAVRCVKTAARACEWWLPPVPDDLPVFAAIPVSGNRTRRRGLVVLRPTRTPEACLVSGVRCASAPETLLACARDLELLDLVVLIDAALHAGDCTVGDLELLAAGRRRGAPRLRQALAMCDGRSESPWETLLRVLHVVCGIRVEPQHEVLDEFGTFVARGDLWLIGTRTLHEYDGGEHLKRQRQRKDLKRSRRVGTADWVRRGYTSEDVLHQAASIVRDADVAVGRDHDPSRVRAWHRLLRDSLFSPAGGTRLRQRLGLDSESGQSVPG